MSKSSAEAVEMEQVELFPQSLRYLGSEGVKAKRIKPQLLETCGYESIFAFKLISPLWVMEI